MDFPGAPSAQLHLTPQNHVADRSRPPRSRFAFLPAAPSLEQTLDRRAQSQQLYSARDLDRSSREADLDGPQRLSRYWFGNLLCLNQSLVGDRYRKKFSGRTTSQPSFLIQLTPVEKLICVQCIPLRYACHRCARHERLLGDPPFFFDRPAAPRPHFS